MSASEKGKWYLVIQGYDSRAPNEAEGLRLGLVRRELTATSERRARTEAMRIWKEHKHGVRIPGPRGILYPCHPRLVQAFDLDPSDDPAPVGAVDPGPPQEGFVWVTLNPRTTFAQAFATARFDQVTSNDRRRLRDAYAKAPHRNLRSVELTVIDIGDLVAVYSVQEVIVWLQERHLRPATIRELLAYSTDHWNDLEDNDLEIAILPQTGRGTRISIYTEHGSWCQIETVYPGDELGNESGYLAAHL